MIPAIAPAGQPLFYLIANIVLLLVAISFVIFNADGLSGVGGLKVLEGRSLYTCSA